MSYSLNLGPVLHQNKRKRKRNNEKFTSEVCVTKISRGSQHGSTGSEPENVILCNSGNETDCGLSSVASNPSNNVFAFGNKENITSPFETDNCDNDHQCSSKTMSRYKAIPQGLRKELLQTKVCLEYNKNVGKCLDCLSFKSECDSEELLCRFKLFRKLSVTTDESEVAIGFANPYEDSTLADLCLWMPSYDGLPVNFDLNASKRIMTHLKNTFNTLVEEEIKCRDAVYKEQPGYISAWKRRLPGVRENCDVCWTSLFNFHWTCKDCGFVVCSACYNSREPNKTRSLLKKKSQRTEGWRHCHDRRSHTSDKLMLTQVIPADCMIKLQELAHSIAHVYEIPQKCTCAVGILENEINCDINLTPDCQRWPESRDKLHSGVGCFDTCGSDCALPLELPAGSLLILDECLSDISRLLFQRKWELGEPVLVRNVHLELNEALWTPDSFSLEFGNEPCDLTNCKDGTTITLDKMKQFWDGFQNVHKRPVAEDGSFMLLKLKDWPTTHHFAEKCRERYIDLMKAVPMPTYTTPTGRLNLAAYLPNTFVPPDLGPKLYIAYGAGPDPDKGTTNLHVDTSDAMNVMLYVGAPKDRQNTADIEVLRQNILYSDADEIAVNHALTNINQVGAIWHIYNANDAQKIRTFLTQIADESNKKPKVERGSDPIHDQGTYLSHQLREQLQKDHEVVGFAIIQYLGDAVFIPAGAPHQVRNVNSSIKAALDFVSPEHVQNCVQLTDQFRYLSQHHNNHEDILQIKSIIYHSVKEAVTALKSFAPLPEHNDSHCSTLSNDGINGGSDVSSLNSELELINCSEFSNKSPNHSGNQGAASVCVNDLISVNESVASTLSCLSDYTEVPVVLDEDRCIINIVGERTASTCQDLLDNIIEEGNSSPDSPRVLIPEDHNSSTDSTSTVATTEGYRIRNGIHNATVGLSCEPQLRGLENGNVPAAIPNPSILDVEKDTELKKKARRREYDKLRGKEQKKKKLATKPIEKEDTELQIWLQMLIAQEKELTPNPDVRLDPPEPIYNLQDIQRYTEVGLEEWIQTQGWHLPIAEPKVWRKRPEIAFKYKANYYYLCVFCKEHPDLAVPESQKQSRKWYIHRLKHQQLRCYDNSCPQRFNNPSRRRRHMQESHCKPVWTRKIPDIPD